MNGHNSEAAAAAAHLREAAATKKCWACGCLHDSLESIEGAFPPEGGASELTEALRTARAPLVEVRYDCLGCEICYPALAVNALSGIGDGALVSLECCTAGAVEEHTSWPPVPGSYTVLRYQAPVAICTLTEEPLSARVAEEAGPEVSIVGTLQTENLGIERLIRNVVTNPNIRFLVLCGSDSTNQIGHLPGQSLLALARFGLDERSRILGAEGKRPFLKNVPREAVRHFCRAVELVDLIGNQKLSDIFEVTGACAARSPGSADPFSAEVAIEPIQGCLPKKSVPDPAGYFVIYVDRRRRLLSLEHYRSDGVLDAVIEGGSAAELYSPAIEKELISRLDHAAYLGRELARAERTLVSGEPYVQDPAPEQHTNG